MKGGSEMKDTQRETTSADALEALSAAQLRSVLRGELESEPVDPARIRRIAAALAAREAETPPDAEQAYRQFLSHDADTEPLYSEAERALALPSEKARPFRRAARPGVIPFFFGACPWPAGAAFYRRPR